MFRIVKKERLNPTVTKMVIDAPFIAKNAISDACTGSNPRQPSQEEMEKLLKCCYYDTDVDF